ncbi:hypothetical protein PL51_19275 [Salmonella enterica]|uniref:Uncharacterized protein n=1 Tax=Salmonella enterica TaxID=28901 RepID=A0A5U2TPY3_SALER|nr:hypothetical protein [Salmonella enterica]EBP2041357.1 hypothetical protein [Salmonella enterica]EBP2047142.1 hypothetical protein [Salmonella enterica]EBP2073901.1 hypothetical protein [Salmonella enterica]EBP2082366.1 hypothetical protein [Salmonella enterica]
MNYPSLPGQAYAPEKMKLFSQDLYPLDATPANLHRLSSSASEAELECCRDGLVMFIIGPSDFPGG